MFWLVIYIRKVMDIELERKRKNCFWFGLRNKLYRFCRNVVFNKIYSLGSCEFDSQGTINYFLFTILIKRNSFFFGIFSTVHCSEDICYSYRVCIERKNNCFSYLKLSVHCELNFWLSQNNLSLIVFITYA
jgi:hypothetical protein